MQCTLTVWRSARVFSYVGRAAEKCADDRHAALQWKLALGSWLSHSFGQSFVVEEFPRNVYYDTDDRRSGAPALQAALAKAWMANDQTRSK